MHEWIPIMGFMFRPVASTANTALALDLSQANAPYEAACLITARA